MKTLPTFCVVLLTVFLVLTNQRINAMEKKSVEKTTVLMCSLESSLATLTNDVGTLANDLQKMASDLNLEIIGPQFWQYTNSDGQPNTKFLLDICIPVKEAKGNPSRFKFVELPVFNCISEIHKGPWNTMMNAYQKIMGEVARKSIPFSGVSREVYILSDFENQENCITEIQFEIY